MLNKYRSKEELIEYHKKNSAPFITKERAYATIEWKHWLHLFSEKPTDILLKSKRNLIGISILIVFLLFNKFQIEKLAFMGIVFKYEESSLYNLLLYILLYFVFMHIVISINDYMEKSLIRYRYFHNNYFNSDDYEKYTKDFCEKAERVVNKQIEEKKQCSDHEIQSIISNYLEREKQILDMKEKLTSMQINHYSQNNKELDDKTVKFENTIFKRELYGVFFYFILYFVPLILGMTSLYFLINKIFPDILSIWKKALMMPKAYF